MFVEAALRDQDFDQQAFDRASNKAAPAHPLDAKAEERRPADQHSDRDDAPLAARGFAADLAIEATVEKRNRTAREDDRMWDVAEHRRHFAEQRVDNEATDQQQAEDRSMPRSSREDQMTHTAVLLCGHGSRDPEAAREFEIAAAGLRRRLSEFDFGTAYLEFARPTIRDGLASLAGRGAKRILAIPGMLFAASHVKNDLPWEINSFIAENPGVDVRFGRDLGIDPKMLQAAAERVAAAATGAPLSETLLVVVGRGTNDPDANSNISKIARMLWEGLGVGWAEAAFSGVAHPRVDAALARAAGSRLSPHYCLSLFPVHRGSGQTHL